MIRSSSFAARTRVCACLVAVFAVACGEATGPQGGDVPVLERVSPDRIVSGSESVTLLVEGRGFSPASRILIDGAEQPTQVGDATRLTVTLGSSELAETRTLQLSVRNPPPGGGVSRTLSVVVGNPVPALADFIPGWLPAGSGETTILVSGRDFRPTSVFRWNGADRPTRFESSEQLEVQLTSADLATGARVPVSVYTPPPDGGSSNRVFVVYNPQPWLHAIFPGHVEYGAGAVRLLVLGEHFVPGAIVRVGGMRLAPSEIMADRLEVEVPAVLTAASGALSISVENPDPVPDPSNVLQLEVQPEGRRLVQLHARHLAWDPVRDVIYASVRDTDASYSGEVVALEPRTGQIMRRVVPGAQPGRLAIADDASVLYVTVDGESGVVRIDLNSFTRDIGFGLGNGADGGVLYVDDMAVLPGAPHSLLVARMDPGWRPRQRGVAVFDDGVMRPLVTPEGVGPNVIEAPSSTLAFGLNQESTGFALYRMEIGESGVVVTDELHQVVQAFDVDMHLADGLLFFTTGEVIDANAMWPVASLGLTGLVATNPGGGRVHYLAEAGFTSVATSTWTTIGTESLPGAPPPLGSFLRWGENGFAYVAPWNVVLFQSDLASR